MTKLLIIDTETTGLETTTSSLCEIAATLYNVGLTDRESGAVASMSILVPVSENGAESVNGITPELTCAISLVREPFNLLTKLVSMSDYLVAFRSEFDKAVVNELFVEYLKTPLRNDWLCAMKDIPWNYPNINAYGNYKLTDLALWLGVGVSSIHRAGDDVRLLVECLNRRKAQLPEMIETAIFRSQSPTLELKALVGFAEKNLAKQAKFIWDGERRGWFKKVREYESNDLLESLPFDVEVLDTVT